MENFLKFSKLTQLLFVSQFLRPLEAFKTKAQVLLSGAVILEATHHQQKQFFTMKVRSRKSDDPLYPSSNDQVDSDDKNLR